MRLFTLALLVQAFHFAEHVAQVVQRSILGQQEAHGLLGAVVDTEWVHFLYNGALLAAGLAFGALVAYVLYEFFDPVNLFAFRLQKATVGTTNVTASRWGWRCRSSQA